MMTGLTPTPARDAYQEQFTSSFLLSKGNVVVLTKDIAAIRVASDHRGRPCLGLMERLLGGSEVEICGEGFSNGTVKVRFADQFYFVVRSSIGLG
jgi:hypothetical protein